jgi:hypothetical protein
MPPRNPLVLSAFAVNFCGQKFLARTKKSSFAVWKLICANPGFPDEHELKIWGRPRSGAPVFLRILEPSFMDPAAAWMNHWVVPDGLRLPHGFILQRPG